MLTDVPTPPKMFDRTLWRRRLARAVALGGADFLLQRAADDIEDRLAAVTRGFATALDLGTPGPQVASVLARRASLEWLVRGGPLEQALGTGHWANVVCDEEALPFDAESFDLVVSALALQSVNDLPGALIQIRRMLKPNGLFLACLIGGQSLTELRTAWAVAESEAAGASPRVAPFADLRDMGGLLQRAGFALPVTDVDTVIVRYDHMFALMADLRAMGATNVLVERSRRPLRRAILARAAEAYAALFSDPDGRVRATFELVWLSGWAPHESQQKPLAPGSARMRLADALRTKEYKTGG
ncbi:MAG TPA: methyltransferase domain-containing protein [Beijerinckiaceae bacterium]|nr:methyltransferase domain-containing protein [Beijerinckiaceae bacterium]